MLILCVFSTQLYSAQGYTIVLHCIFSVPVLCDVYGFSWLFYEKTNKTKSFFKFQDTISNSKLISSSTVIGSSNILQSRCYIILEILSCKVYTIRSLRRYVCPFIHSYLVNKMSRNQFYVNTYIVQWWGRSSAVDEYCWTIPQQTGDLSLLFSSFL